MKYIIKMFLFVITLSACSTGIKEVEKQKAPIIQAPKIDERVELLSIVFRLAGNHEYSQSLFPNYVEGIEKHFDKFKNHTLIRYVKDELQTEGIGFSSVMSMAIHITEPPNMFFVIDSFINDSLEEPWQKENAVKFLKLLNEFYADTDCETFFDNNKELYTNASRRFMKVYENIDLDWYQNFYGVKPKGEFRIINALGNGGANYGPKIIFPNKEEIIYAIMGTWSVDDLGIPVYDVKSYFPTLLHEFNHSFVNDLVNNNRLKLKKSGKIIFDKVKDEMNRQAYGNWKTMYDEALVRAAVIKYMKDHNFDKQTINNELNEQLNNGFLWTAELVDELERYDNNRDKYPTLESFMSDLVVFFNKIATEIDIPAN